MSRLTIQFSPEVLEALRASKSITVKMTTGGGSNGRANGSLPGVYRDGSLPDRLCNWFKKRGELKTPAVSKKFKLTRAHASMLLSRLANESKKNSAGLTLVRRRRGVYEVVSA